MVWRKAVLLPTLIIVIFCGTVSVSGQALQPSSPTQSTVPVPVKQDGKWGYKDNSGRLVPSISFFHVVVIVPQFENAQPFSGGFAAVSVRSSIAPVDATKWGFINETGNLVIAPDFAAVGNFSEGLAAVSYQQPWSNTDTRGYIDKQGKMVIKPQFNEAYPFSEGLALVWAGGANLTDPVVKSFVKMGYIDKTGRWVIRSRYSYFFYNNFSEGMVPFRKNWGNWGYMSEKGKVVIEPRFE